mmetsp:Transcript_20130/g.59465  ORF Transcript_20130/g.59465 Transcript_20130/m.59465 type:complete len:87 (+) Transcript_20130:842-1102(+)
MGPEVEEDVEHGRSCIIGVLDHLLQEASLLIILQNLLDAPADVNFLPKISHRHLPARLCLWPSETATSTATAVPAAAATRALRWKQ